MHELLVWFKISVGGREGGEPHGKWSGSGGLHAGPGRKIGSRIGELWCVDYANDKKDEVALLEELVDGGRVATGKGSSK